MSDGIYSKLSGYHNRRSIRLSGYDYSQPGYYFVTICIHNRKELFLGDISDGKFVENAFSAIVRTCWNDLPKHYQNVNLDEFIIMPNHVHGIIRIVDDIAGAGFKPAPTVNKKRHGLPEIIRAFKSFSSRRISETGQLFKWQRNFYDHIIRDTTSLFCIRKYIQDNPSNWKNDSENHLDTEIVESDLDDPDK